MASLIVFNTQGKATWIPLKSGEQIMRKIPRAIVEFTDADKQWFRKPLGKQMRYPLDRDYLEYVYGQIAIMQISMGRYYRDTTYGGIQRVYKNPAPRDEDFIEIIWPSNAQIVITT